MAKLKYYDNDNDNNNLKFDSNYLMEEKKQNKKGKIFSYIAG